MNNTGEFSLVEPMNIDDGELDGLSNEMCFVLGTEWENIRHLLLKKQSFRIMFHSENLTPITSMCQRHKVSFEVSHHDDWPVLIVS